MLRHLQHAARTVRPKDSSKLHAAFIEFKQAYGTILGRLSGSTSAASACPHLCSQLSKDVC
eukprot:1137998-Pelagomonas_calceolata.AAC.5